MWWVGLQEVGTWDWDGSQVVETRLENNNYFSWQETDEDFPNDSPLWSDGSPSYTESFPLAGLLLPSGFLTDVPSSGSIMTVNKLVFPICKLGEHLSLSIFFFVLFYYQVYLAQTTQEQAQKIVNVLTLCVTKRNSVSWRMVNGQMRVVNG